VKNHEVESSARLKVIKGRVQLGKNHPVKVSVGLKVIKEKLQLGSKPSSREFS